MKPASSASRPDGTWSSSAPLPSRVDGFRSKSCHSSSHPSHRSPQDSSHPHLRDGHAHPVAPSQAGTLMPAAISGRDAFPKRPAHEVRMKSQNDRPFACPFTRTFRNAGSRDQGAHWMPKASLVWHFSVSFLDQTFFTPHRAGSRDSTGSDAGPRCPPASKSQKPDSKRLIPGFSSCGCDTGKTATERLDAGPPCSVDLVWI